MRVLVLSHRDVVAALSPRACAEAMAAVNGPVGVATLLFGAIGIFAHLDLSFDRIWKVPAASESVLL